MVAYKRSYTFSTLITHKVNVGRGISHPCGNFMLWDQGGEDGMIKNRLHKIKNLKNE